MYNKYQAADGMEESAMSDFWGDAHCGECGGEGFDHYSDCSQYEIEHSYQCGSSGSGGRLSNFACIVCIFGGFAGTAKLLDVFKKDADDVPTILLIISILVISFTLAAIISAVKRRRRAR